MKKSDLKYILITVIACGLTAGALLFLEYRSHKKIAVVDAVKLFNSYKMKVEMETAAAGSLKLLAGKADSLKNELAVRSKAQSAPRAELETLFQSFRQAQSDLEQAYQESNQDINEQVWKRLNPLIDEYGKAQGFRLIIGANGMGSVLYNDDYYDRTQALIDFVNKKYESGH